MSTEPKPDTQTAPETSEFTEFQTANDRFKRSFNSWFWGSMVAAVVVHFAVMALWPNLRASDVSYTMEDFEAIDLPPEIEIPPPPEQIQRPANPVVSDAIVDDDITISPTTFDDNQPDDLPPPPTDTGAGLGDQPTFTPYEVRPELLNTREVMRALENEYPATLRDSGISGRVVLHLFVNEEGVVQNTEVSETSGYASMDAAAARVAQTMRFSPALNREERVPVWIEQPITFTTGR